jgi:hypothetical protein
MKWTICVEDGTKRLVPGKGGSEKFDSYEECLHACMMENIIRDFNEYMKRIEDPAGIKQLFKCLKSIATGYAVGSTMAHAMTKLGLVRSTMLSLTETGFDFLIYLAKK